MMVDARLSFVVCCLLWVGGGWLLVVVRWRCDGSCWRLVDDVWLVLGVRRLLAVDCCLLLCCCWLLVVGCCWLLVVVVYSLLVVRFCAAIVDCRFGVLSFVVRRCVLFVVRCLPRVVADC